MRLFLLVIAAILLNAYEVNILNVNQDTAVIDNYVKKGVSGVVLCPYEGKRIICARAVCFGKRAKLKIYDNLKNEAFALPLVVPKKGDKILFSKYGGTEVKVDGEDYMIMREDDILGVM